MNRHAIYMEGVGKDYPHFSLNHLDLTVAEGGIMGLIGANGAGKSTTIRILLGLVRPDRGDVHILGLPMPAEQIAIKWDIGFVSEDMRLFKAGTLRWHMDFLRSMYPGWDPAYATELARRFDLQPQRKIKGLSHGERVKATLLLALARRPRLLVLDEPTTGLDPVARHEVLGALMEVLEDEHRSILFSSQNTLDVEQISDCITFIDRGRIIDQGDKEVFLDRWRRLRLELPGGQLPAIPGIVQRRAGERVVVITTDRYDEALIADLQVAGATILAVETMSLEEIFVTNVLSRREEMAA